jgi:hypothetical protein
MMAIPTHFSGPEARLVAQLLEVLIDALIDFHVAFSEQYRDWLELPDPPEDECRQDGLSVSP